MTENEPEGLRARNIFHNEYPLQTVSRIGIEVSRVTARKIVAHIGLGEVKQRRESDSGFEMVGHHDSFFYLIFHRLIQLSTWLTFEDNQRA